MLNHISKLIERLKKYFRFRKTKPARCTENLLRVSECSVLHLRVSYLVAEWLRQVKSCDWACANYREATTPSYPVSSFPFTSGRESLVSSSLCSNERRLEVWEWRQPKKEEVVIKRAITTVVTAINSDNQRLNLETIHKTINTKFGDLSQNLTGNKVQTAVINIINSRIFV